MHHLRYDFRLSRLGRSDDLADDLIKLGKAKTILVIGGETLSRVTDPYDRNKMFLLMVLAL
jgi:hypothetical protein